jgi:hypothetical protein
MIQDMSYPWNSPTVTSVNAGIDPDSFPTAWGSFEATSALILSLPTGCVAATFNISAAYRLTPIRPSQQQHLCIFWKGRIYVDRAVMFGLSSSAGVFGAIADMLVALYQAVGFSMILTWVNDFFVIR